MASGTAARGIRKLFIGNLPWTVGNTELKQYFSQFGHITSAKVIFNRDNGMSKHYAFLEINDKDTYETILNRQNHKLEGKILSIKHVVD